MGAFNAGHREPIKSRDWLLGQLDGQGRYTELLAGGEQEVFLLDSSGILIEDARHQALRSKAESVGVSVKPEPGAFQGEVNTRACSIADLHAVASDVQNQIATVIDTGAEMGIILSPFSIVPMARPSECRSKLIIPDPNDPTHYSHRPTVMLKAFMTHMGEEAANYPVVNICNHFTHGISDRRHFLEMARLNQALAAADFLLTENRTRFQRGSDKRINIHTGIFDRAMLNVRTPHNHGVRRGLSPDFLFASNQDEFFERYVDMILHARMVAFYDHNDAFKPAPPGKFITAQRMQGLGPETMSQFEMSMSQFWWRFKFKNTESGMLLEHRDFDASPGSAAYTALVWGMLGLDDEARRSMIKRLDEKYGIPIMRQPDKAEQIIRRNMVAALHRGDPARHGTDRHLLSPFGSRNHTVLDFLRQDLLPMLEDYYQNRPEAAMLDNLRLMADAGYNEAQLWHDNLLTQDHMSGFMREMAQSPATMREAFATGTSWTSMAAGGDLPGIAIRKPVGSRLVAGTEISRSGNVVPLNLRSPADSSSRGSEVGSSAPAPAFATGPA